MVINNTPNNQINQHRTTIGKGRVEKDFKNKLNAVSVRIQDILPLIIPMIIIKILLNSMTTTITMHLLLPSIKPC